MFQYVTPEIVSVESRAASPRLSLCLACPTVTSVPVSRVSVLT